MGSALPDGILRFAEELELLPDSGVVLVCVSGGADSMCLLEALLEISGERGFTVSAVHYNHGLRGEESLRDESFVRDYCRMRGVTLYSGSGDVKGYARSHGVGIEEAARDLRYEFFYDIAVKIGATRIATAHTADDNAETIIMNLARGSGAKGLSGIPPERPIFQYMEETTPTGGTIPTGETTPTGGTQKRSLTVIRPMLRASRDDVLLFISNRGIPYVEDSTNCLDVYTRNMIRHKVIPVMKEINPRFIDAIKAVSELSRADEEYLSGLADNFIENFCVPHTAINPVSISVDARELFALPLAIAGRVVRKICAGNLSYRHVEAVLKLCGRSDPSASLSLPGMTVYREYGRIVFGLEQEENNGGFEPIYPVDGEAMMIPCSGLKISCKLTAYNGTINKSLTSFLFKSNDLCGKMTVRSRREGDAIRLADQNCTKTLKKLFIERHIPARKRSIIPVIADDEGVLAVYGIGMGNRAVPEPGDLAVLIDFEEIE